MGHASGISPYRLAWPARARILALALVLLGGAWRSQAGEPARAESSPVTRTPTDVTVVDAGPLRLRLYLSHTAQLFHVVDQLSEWSPFCHRQYRRALTPLDEREEESLVRYREVRARHPWGAGLEQAFYTWLPLERAVGQAVATGGLTARDAETVGEVLRRFEPKLGPLVAAEAPRLEWFLRRIQSRRGRLADLSSKLGRWFGVSRLEVDAFLIANPSPDSFGGGFNGGRLTLEVPRAADPLPMLFHELLHAFVDPRRSSLERRLAEAGAPGLDFETFNEGLAYALSPGIHTADGGGDDELALELEELSRSGATLADYRYRVLRYALALRPLVVAALESETGGFDDFVPGAIFEWRRLTAESAAPNESN